MTRLLRKAGTGSARGTGQTLPPVKRGSLWRQGVPFTARPCGRGPAAVRRSLEGEPGPDSFGICETVPLPCRACLHLASRAGTVQSLPGDA